MVTSSVPVTNCNGRQFTDRLLSSDSDLGRIAEKVRYYLSRLCSCGERRSKTRKENWNIQAEK